MSKEQSFREALARIAAGFYTEKGAENHAKDVIRLVDSQGEPEAVSSKNVVAALSELLRLKDLKTAAQAINTSGSWEAVHRRDSMLSEYQAKRAEAWANARIALLEHERDARETDSPQKWQTEIAAMLDNMGKLAVRVRPGGGAEDVLASLAITLAKVTTAISFHSPDCAEKSESKPPIVFPPDMTMAESHGDPRIGDDPFSDLPREDA